ncbi:hypothetical protein FRC07_010956 [Ceratobasidium sp. 392]|nr:hypothetical protein FRC07_010956 [Ceratobasidium sp. 392]
MALWSVWKNPDDSIPNGAEPIPEDSSYTEDHIRSRQQIFSLTILLSAASHLLTSWSITLEDVSHGQTLLQRYCQGLLHLAVQLKPNRHFAMHYKRSFQRYGPAYAWLLFAYECFNGILEKVQINCHPEDYETILARFWTCMHRLYEMLWKPGTLLAAKAMLAQEVQYTTGKQLHKQINLHGIKSILGLYFLMVNFARTCWPHLQLTSDQEREPGGYPFIYDRVAETLPVVYQNGIKFGCETAKRTKADRFAFVKFGDPLIPCRLEYLFRLTVKDEEARLCAAVAPMVADKAIPVMPWDKYALELGTFTAYANKFAPFRVIAIKQIVAPMALCKLRARSQVYPHTPMDLWIAILYDQTGTEEDGDDAKQDEEDQSDELT